MIYKILSNAEWQAALAIGRFDGSAIDLKDGYIHFSTAAQMRETAAKHFAGQTDLTLLEVGEHELGDALKWEVSRGGALFPHLYTALATNKVKRQWQLPWNGSVHQFPEDI